MRRRAAVPLAAFGVLVVATGALLWKLPNPVGPRPPRAVDLGAVPTAVFEKQLQVTVGAAPDYGPLCSMAGPPQLLSPLRSLAGTRCPLTLDATIGPASKHLPVLTASLVTLSAPASPAGPKSTGIPRVSWIVFYRSGREAIGDHYVAIYDACSGAPVVTVMLYWPVNPSPAVQMGA